MSSDGDATAGTPRRGGSAATAAAADAVQTRRSDASNVFLLIRYITVIPTHIRRNKVRLDYVVREKFFLREADLFSPNLRSKLKLTVGRLLTNFPVRKGHIIKFNDNFLPTVISLPYNFLTFRQKIHLGIKVGYIYSLF